VDDNNTGKRREVMPPSFLYIHFITISLPPSSESSSPLLPLNPPPHYLSLLLHPPHYLSPSFLSVILTTSLPLSSQSSSLPLSFLPPSHPHHLSILHSFKEDNDEEVVKQVLKRRFEGRG
jgi:hypothetical protein